VLKLNQTWWPAFRSRAAATRALWAIVAVVSAIVDERENHNFPCSTICQGLLLSFYPPPFFYLAFFRFSLSFFFLSMQSLAKFAYNDNVADSQRLRWGPVVCL